MVQTRLIYSHHAHPLYQIHIDMLKQRWGGGNMFLNISKCMYASMQVNASMQEVNLVIFRVQVHPRSPLPEYLDLPRL